MTKQEILNGMSEKEFYKLYPTKAAWEQAQKMQFGGIPFGAGIMLQQGGPSPVQAIDPDVWEKMYGKSVSGFNDPKGTTTFPAFNMRSAYDKFKSSNPNFALYSDADMEALGVTIPASPNAKAIAEQEAKQQLYKPVYQTPITTPIVNRATGGGLSRSDDYGSKKKPYPSVDSSDFAGGARSYPIPTRADAIDALRLAGLHGRADVKSKVYAKYPDLKKAFGGDITEQGGNEDFIKQRNNNYTSFIKNNVMKNLQQEEFNKVHNAYMQAEHGYHMMPDGSMMPNGMMQVGGVNPDNKALQQMYLENMNKFQPTHSNLLHQMAAEFGPSSRRTGLPLFPGNMSPYYGINKKDSKDLVNTPEGFKMKGFEMTPKYGLLGRTALGRYMGIGPKKIHYKFTGNTMSGPSPYNQGPLVDPSLMPNGSSQDSFPMNPNVGPLATQDQTNQTDPMQGWIPKQIYMQSQLQQKQYGGNPIAMENNWSFLGTPKPIDYRANAFGPNGGVDNTIMKGDDNVSSDITVEGDLRRKWNGVGETIGQWTIPAVNTLSSLFEAKDYRKNKKKLEQSMLADNTFLNTPMNAKNRGDYDPNSGMFRPDQKVPVQFPGYMQWGGFNTMQFGGMNEGEELELSPEEIADLKAQGYELEELD